MLTRGKERGGGKSDELREGEGVSSSSSKHERKRRCKRKRERNSKRT